MHLGNLLQSEGGVAVAGPVQIVPVRRGSTAQHPRPSAPPTSSRPARGTDAAAAAAAAAAVLGLGDVTSRGHVAAAAAAAAAGTEASRAARRAAAAAAGSWRAWALGSRGRCWPQAARARAPVDRPAAAAAHTAGAAAAAAAAAAGESDPAPSIATLRGGPEVSAAAAAHIQFAGGREPARRASLSFGRFRGTPCGPQHPLPAPRPAPRPLHCRKSQRIPVAPAGRAGSLGASRVARAAAEGKRRAAAAAGSEGARRVSALPGRGSRRCRCSRGGCCWRWRIQELLLGLLGLWLLGSRWLLGPGLCFLVLLGNPLDHSVPVQRASLAPGTWGLRSVCVQRAAAAAAP